MRDIISPHLTTLYSTLLCTKTRAYRVGCGDFLEFFCGLLVTAGAVRVVLHRQLLVGRVDLLLRRSPRHLLGSDRQGFVERFSSMYVMCGGGTGGGVEGGYMHAGYTTRIATSNQCEIVRLSYVGCNTKKKDSHEELGC